MASRFLAINYIYFNICCNQRMLNYFLLPTLSALIAGFVGWYFGASRQPNPINDQQNDQLLLLTKTLEKNQLEINSFAKQLSLANEQLLNAQHEQLQEAFLSNGQNIEAVLLKQSQAIDSIYQEKNNIAEQFTKTNEQLVSTQRNQLNEAFMVNGRSAELITAELKEAQESVNTAFNVLPELYDSSKKMSDTAQQSKQQVKALADSVYSWQGSIATLQSILSLIDGIHQKSIQIRDISFEANILALNASIEAAQAGEHGNGFAVVAESMRELSKKSEATSLEINSSVELTRSEVFTIVKGIENSVGLLSQVSTAVTNQFSLIEAEVMTIDDIAQRSSMSAGIAKEKFEQINTKVNVQLEDISKLLADAMGVVTGNKITDVSPSADFTNMKIIDVRRKDEFNGELGHIAGAELICLQDNFEARIDHLNKNEPHLFVCRSGGRSARAARIALAHGFKHVYNMEGGMLAWDKIWHPS
jgi:methyl-accepting chemotaxis protein/rhodanese-related sulfurtransferase